MFGLKKKAVHGKAYYIAPAGARYWKQGAEILKEAHILIGGSTGCGKSTLIKKLMWTALASPPGTAAGCKQFIIADMKMGVEMFCYRNLPHVLRFAENGHQTLSALDFAIDLTKNRLEDMKSKGLTMYEGSDVYVVIDELGFLLQECGRDALDKLTLIGRIARAARVHLLMATQDPSRRGCPSAIQVNCTCLIGMKCRDSIQSRQIIGMNGCEALPRYGMAYMVKGCDTFILPITLENEPEYQERIDFWLDKSRCIVYK